MASNPSTISSHHLLTLLKEPPPGWGVICDVCDKKADGLFYICMACNFCVHPDCTKNPLVSSSPCPNQHLNQGLVSHHHPQCRLNLITKPAPGWAFTCDVCDKRADGPFYACASCNFCVHPHCTKTPVVSSSSSQNQHFNEGLFYKHSSPDEFKCNGCNTCGSGTSYRYASLPDFKLHEECATATLTISSNHHPQHHLTLVNGPRNGKSFFCYVCYNPADGFRYTCELCDFDIHPPCTKAPVSNLNSCYLKQQLMKLKIQQQQQQQVNRLQQEQPKKSAVGFKARSIIKLALEVVFEQLIG